MDKVVIRIETLGKRYRIGEDVPYKTLRDAIARAGKAPVRALRSGNKTEPEAASGLRPDGHVWALRNVSLNVEQGEAVGIIGPNGAGKTTLLKILSRITEPTEGWASIRGRVRSLLAGGTGVHMER